MEKREIHPVELTTYRLLLTSYFLPLTFYRLFGLRYQDPTSVLMSHAGRLYGNDSTT